MRSMCRIRIVLPASLFVLTQRQRLANHFPLQLLPTSAISRERMNPMRIIVCLRKGKDRLEDAAVNQKEPFVGSVFHKLLMPGIEERERGGPGPQEEITSVPFFLPSRTETRQTTSLKPLLLLLVRSGLQQQEVDRFFLLSSWIRHWGNPGGSHFPSCPIFGSDASLTFECTS